MNKALDRCLKTEWTLTKNVTITFADMLLLLLITAFGIFARMTLFGYVSGDYTGFLEEWFTELKAAGGFPGVALSLGDYTPPYIYIMALLTYVPMEALFSIKLVSCCFDYVLAFYVLFTVYYRWRKIPYAILAYALVLFAPTVLMNGAFWAQCDSIFTGFLVMCVYYFLQKRPLAASVCFSVAFVFKLQAIFLAPFLLAMWLKGRMKARHFLMIPAVYLISILPAWIMGRPLLELLTVYLRQTGTYSRISLNAPNLYYFIYEDRSRTLSAAAILLCAAAVMVLLYVVYRKGFQLTDGCIVNLALFSALLVPYLLPHMHERYFYVADVLAVVYAFYRPKRFYVSLMVIFASTAGYLPFLFGHSPISLKLAAVVMGAALVVTGRDFVKSTLRPEVS